MSGRCRSLLCAPEIGTSYRLCEGRCTNVWNGTKGIIGTESVPPADLFDVDLQVEVKGQARPEGRGSSIVNPTVIIF